MRYADDTALLTTSKVELEHADEVLTRHSAEFILRINQSKTSAMMWED